jgi:hypothetical protein
VQRSSFAFVLAIEVSTVFEKPFRHRWQAVEDRVV